MRALLVFAMLLLSGCLGATDADAPVGDAEQVAEAPGAGEELGARGANPSGASVNATQLRIESVLCGEFEYSASSVGVGARGYTSASCRTSEMEIPDFEFNSVLWEIRWSATDLDGGMYFNANDGRCTAAGGAGCGVAGDVSDSNTLRGAINASVLKEVEFESMYAVLNSAGAQVDIRAEFWLSFFEADQVPREYSVFEVEVEAEA